MKDIHNDENIDAVRARLYERGNDIRPRTPTPFVDTPDEVPETWSAPPEPKPVLPSEPMPMKKNRRKKYRKVVILSSIAFFFVALIASSGFLFLGNNSISGENIELSLSGPFTIGGGEKLSLQLGVTNANSVPIQSATLIMEYPNGTKSVGENPRDLFIERLPLDSINSGESINLPVQVIIFGEENDSLTVKASIEYRVEGSNATFFKEAESLQMKISSAPAVLQVKADTKASSGQETDIEVIITSNSPTPLTNVLLQVDYPNGFSYTSASPSPSSGRDQWLVSELGPGEEEIITITGVVGGEENDAVVVNFSLGVPSERDEEEMATVFNTASTEYMIENPFLGLELIMNGETDGEVVTDVGKSVSGEVIVTNTTSDTIYDTVVTVTFGGNAVSDPAVSLTDGFYRSIDDTITWDPASTDRLRELLPGDSVTLTFSLRPDEEVERTPRITLVADAVSRRVSESRVPEELTGSIEGEIKVATVPIMSGNAEYVSGAMPPAAEKETEYIVKVVAENGGNGLNDVEVTFTLPPYVTWQGATSGPGDFNYNPSSRLVTWTAGDIAALNRATAIVSIAMLPSISQINSIPTLINEQSLKGTDAYTGTVVRTTSNAVTTELPESTGLERDNGRVAE